MSEEKKVHPLKRAWAAGVFDARAMIPKSGAQIRIESTDEAMINRFLEAVQVGSVTDRFRPKVSSHPIFTYRTNSLDEARALCLLLAPFLGPRQTKAAAEMVARVERNPYWQKKQKATSSDTSPAPNAEA